MVKEPNCLIVGASGYIGAVLLDKVTDKWSALGTSSRKMRGMVQLHLQDPNDFDYELVGS